MWIRLYLYVVLALILTGILYVGILPSMVSSSFTLSVIVGIAAVVVWPALVVWFFTKRVRKFIQCVKS